MRLVLLHAFPLDARMWDDVRRALANAIPGGRLRALPQAGHLAPLERPEAFTAVVSAFLEEIA